MTPPGRPAAPMPGTRPAQLVGSILLAGFFLIPALGFENSIRLAVGINLLLAVATLVSRRPVTETRLGRLRRLQRSRCWLTGRAYRWVLSTRPLPALAVVANPFSMLSGRSATVFLKRFQGYFLPADQRPARSAGRAPRCTAATTQPEMADGAAGRRPARRGFDTHRRFRWRRGHRGRAADRVRRRRHRARARGVCWRMRPWPMRDATTRSKTTRVNIVTNDARNALYLTSKQYDVIVSQPSHPWTAGASHLYTSEFVGLAKSRLTQAGGVYVQWINSLFVDEAVAEIARGDTARSVSECAPLPAGTGGRAVSLRQTRASRWSGSCPSGRPMSDAVLHYSVHRYQCRRRYARTP